MKPAITRQQASLLLYIVEVNRELSFHYQYIIPFSFEN